MAISVEKKGAENNDNALNKKEAALIKNRKALIYGVLAIIIIIAGYLLTRLTMLSQERTRQALQRQGSGLLRKPAV